MSITYIWLAAGILLLIAEIVHIPGVGLMFAGLGAISASLAISAGYLHIDDTLFQAITFLLATALWTALLWKPLQKFRLGKTPNGYSNIVGEHAVVAAGGLSKANGGNVTWSGTTMKAKLIPDAGVDALLEGAHVTIVAVTGATLIVKP